MSKTSLVLIVIFLISLVSLLTLNTLYSPSPVLTSFPAIFPTKTVTTENSITLTPNPLIVMAGNTAGIQVNIDSRGEKPNLIQLELSYDPSVIRSVNIVPGTYFQNPQVLLKNVNARNGRISYAISPSAGQEDAQGSTVVATINVTPHNTPLRSTTELSFLPKTVVRTENSQNTLKKSIGTKIIIVPGKNQEASPSGLLLP